MANDAMIFPHGQTITVWREVTDRFGDVTIEDERTITGVAVAPASSSENADGRVQVTTGVTLYCPAGSGLTATHRVQLEDGTTWRVSGRPGAWRSPLTGWAPGDQAELEQVTG